MTRLPHEQASGKTQTRMNVHRQHDLPSAACRDTCGCSSDHLEHEGRLVVQATGCLITSDTMLDSRHAGRCLNQDTNKGHVTDGTSDTYRLRTRNRAKIRTTMVRLSELG